MDFTVRGRDGDSLVRVAALEPPTTAAWRGGAIIIADQEALRLHGAALPDLPRVVVPRGEAAKTLESLESLYGAFLERGIDRSSTVIAFGGGTVSDLAGFAASTWLRGVAFEYLPTTLLAMVDASVGGKTGIDFRGRKNLIGSFCQPRRVLADVAFLDTLSDTEFASGMAEVIKHAVIAGGEYAAFIGGLGGRRPRAAEPGGRDALERIVGGSVAIKAGIVSRDEREAGGRRILNLGHSIGHALELELDLPHGQAVSAGLASAARLAEARGAMGGATLSAILSLIAAWGLPASLAEVLGRAGAARASVTRHRVAEALGADKKREGSTIRFALPCELGRVEILELPLAELADFVLEAP
jgi:3-dehydroquinate synthase